ncbi:uncharacterized protein [Procambarus clarkii]|uniref:uncharacterized protein n=1 Tax=Procambarus clarkii TaxID=6728 RepID=UPI0037435D1C
MADCAAFISTVTVLVLVEGVHLPPPHLSLSTDLLTQDPLAAFHHRLRPNPNLPAHPAHALTIHSTNSNSIIPAPSNPSPPHFTQANPKITSFTPLSKPFPPNKPFLPPNAHNKQFLHPNKPFPPFSPHGKPKTSPFPLQGRPGLHFSPNSKPSPHFNGPAANFNGPAIRFNGPAGHFNGPAAHFNGPAAHFNGPPAHFNGPAAHFNGPAAHFNGPPAHFNGPAANFKNPAANFKNPAANFKNPAANFKNPGANFNNPAANFKNPGAQLNHLAAHAAASRIPSQAPLSDLHELGQFRDPHLAASAFFPKQGINLVDKVDVEPEEPTGTNFFPSDGYDLDSYFNDFPVFGYFDFEPSPDGEKLPLAP